MEFRGKKYSVPFALPGDQVQFKILRKGRKSKFQVVHIEKGEPPPEEIVLSQNPGCQHAGLCGGCRARHLDYEFQWKWKSAPILENMKERFGISPELLAAPSLEGFRNRMDYAVEKDRIGLRPPQDFETVLDLQQCSVLRPPGEELLQMFRSLLQTHEGAGWDRREENGWLKYVTIRVGVHSGVLVLTTSGQRNAASEALLKDLLQRVQSANEKGWNSNSGIPFSIVETITAPGQELSCTPGGTALLGEGSYTDTLAGHDFLVPYDAFFQPNPVAFGRLLQRILDLGEPYFSEEPTLTDLYCGAGVLSYILGERRSSITSIHGYEFVESAVKQAEELFSHSGQSRTSIIETSFQAVDLNQPENLKLDSGILLADPPRAGLSPALCKMIAENKPAPVFLYISCNPETQLRDLNVLSESYQVKEAVLADCFPYTAHMEQAILLTRR